MEAKIASLKEHNQRLTDTGAALVTELEAVMTENHSLKATIAEKDAIINKQHSICTNTEWYNLLIKLILNSNELDKNILIKYYIS